MSLKKLIIIVVVLFLITLALLGALFFVSKQTPNWTPQGERETELSPVSKNAPEPEPKEEPKNEKEPKEKELKEFDESLFDAGGAVAPSENQAERAALEIFVRSFIEDYGSFSTVGGYGHIEAHYPKMTRSLREFIEAWIAENPAKQKSISFYSVQTSVAGMRFDEFDKESAIVVVETSRVETDIPAYYNRRVKQDVEVKMAKQKGEWKVAWVYWR